MAKSSNPVTPTMVPVDSRVVLVVSDGPKPTIAGTFIEVPGVEGFSQGAALKHLQDVGLSARVVNDYSEKVPRGKVIGQLPEAGLSATANDEIILLISSGAPSTEPGYVELPEVIGRTEAEGVSQVEDARLTPQVFHEWSPTVPAGIVMSQFPNRAWLANQDGGKPKWIAWLISAVLLLVIAGVAFFGLRSTDRVVVPEVVGKTQSEAVAMLHEVGLEAQVEIAEDAGDAAPDTVLAQDPKGGTGIRPGGVVTLTVTPLDGEQLVRVPNIRGMSQDDAIAEIKAAGFIATTSTQESSEVSPGQVLSQDPPAGSQAPAGSIITLTIAVAKAPTEVTVPNLRGITRTDAESTLGRAGLRAFIVEVPSADVAEGVVIDQLPAAGSIAAEGSTVAVLVSGGAPEDARTVEVPNVVGSKLEAAKGPLGSAGLQVHSIEVAGAAAASGQIIAQVPAAGSVVPVGYTVVLLYVK